MCRAIRRVQPARGRKVAPRPAADDGSTLRLVSRPFRHRIRVRYSECDLQGVVFNANYLTYLDEAMTELFRTALDGGYRAMVDAGVDMVVAESSLRYLAPARFDDEIEVEATVTRLGTTGMTTAMRIVRDGDGAHRGRAAPRVRARRRGRQGADPRCGEGGARALRGGLMVHLRIVAPHDAAMHAADLLEASPSVSSVVVLEGAARKPQGDMIFCDIAREDASVIIDDLRELDIPATGSISIETIDSQISDAAERAVEHAPGLASDAVHLGGRRAPQPGADRAIGHVPRVHGAFDADRRGRHPARPADTDRGGDGRRARVRAARRAVRRVGGAPPRRWSADPSPRLRPASPSGSRSPSWRRCSSTRRT